MSKESTDINIEIESEDLLLRESVDEDNILDWGYYIKDPLLSKSKTIIIKAKYMGRAKPLPYIEEDENE